MASYQCLGSVVRIDIACKKAVVNNVGCRVLFDDERRDQEITLTKKACLQKEAIMKSNWEDNNI